MQLIDFFDKGAARDPARAFLVDDAGGRTYGQVQALSHRIVNALRRDGVAAGAKAAVYAPNATRAFECVIGIIRACCVWVPVNVRNLVGDTAFVLDNTDTELLFYSAEFADQAHELLRACPRIRRAICLDSAATGHVGFDAWLADTAERSEETPASRDDPITLFSSGGTTGRPKGVVMSHACWETMIAGTLALQPHAHPVHLVAAPMTHAAGGGALALLPMAATNVMLPAFDPVRVMEAIERHRVTHLFLPPTAVYRLLAHPDVRNYDYSSLRYFNYASAPMSPDKVREAIGVFGPVMMTAFGQSECGVNISFFSPQDHVDVLAAPDSRRLASCGRASPFARVAIMDEQGGLLAPGEHGEIVVRSNSVMRGYYKNPEETARAREHGWHHTGDIGYLDPEGWLYLVDRKRDMIISGGFNIFPSEIEKVVLAHPAVQDCSVVGVPDELWGEAIKAVVQLKPGGVFDAAEMEAFCRRSLGGYKVPKSFEVWPELPRSPVGKVLKREVRARFWQGQGRNI
ncbi:class I adenylate-forming enzyme family protein [Pseudoduganella namucuonensis]|uniref:Acyl-CoA synthetase (AMP-forming)/AMP-acid ligase II n=1 Tax=Pseudoduganella namucuonensis TaxID=1035707 RepID=A0A1I7LE50_9BURK|nr:AMP-binding protein [Pseudoduganella namucuonensis]SFV07969.1 Acyl-CoA synthetase (AMP-forming)/AMP-acid ligase II [Pseudoduganella namucuonensis]